MKGGRIMEVVNSVVTLLSLIVVYKLICKLDIKK